MIASEPARIRARLVWTILSLVLPATFRQTSTCRSPALAFSAAIHFAMKCSAPRSAMWSAGHGENIVRVVCRSRLRSEITDHVFTHEGDVEVHHHIQRRGSRPGVQPNEIVCIPRRERQPQHRPVHRGRPAHTQRMVRLPQVHPRTVRPIKRPLRAQNTDAKSGGTRDNAVRLRHVEPTRARHCDTLRRVHQGFLSRFIGWRKNNRTDHPISYVDTLVKK